MGIGPNAKILEMRRRYDEISGNSPTGSLPLPPNFHIVMNGDRLDIQVSVDLEGLKKLRIMLETYQSILEMMQPDNLMPTSK